MKKKILGLALLTIMLAMPMMISLVEATDWVEVARWSGYAFPDPEHFETEQFECSHVEWRIKWSYVAEGSPFESIFVIKIYKEGVSDYINLILKTGYINKSGIKNIHDNNGTFYLDITAANIDEYTIIIEQDVDSIPEFTPATVAIVLIAVSILAVVLSKKFKKRMKREVDEVYQELLQMLKTPSP